MAELGVLFLVCAALVKTEKCEAGKYILISGFQLLVKASVVEQSES